MKDVITIGDAMITLNPSSTGPMKFVNSFERRAGGAEFNFAIGCARLGLETGWISRLGKDEFGQYIRSFARGEGIDTTEVRLEEGYATSLNFKEIQASGAGRTFYYRHPSPTEKMTAENLSADYVQSARLLHITGVFPAVVPENLEVTKRAVQLAKEAGMKVSLDPNIRLKLWTAKRAKDALYPLLKDVDLLLAGEEELEIILGTSDPKEVFARAKELGIEFVAIKKGEEGAIASYRGEVLEVPAVPAQKVVDTVGAGDGFDAGIVYGYLNGWTLEKTMTFAATIGSMVVEVVGDNEGLPVLEDVEQRLGS
ncbi:sugar kinase [Geomicrobium sp. JCM 19039]|uniref:sugar kinase n=1 Tax=Geomicrobium sp. JCM 19039 TaxID=1460636 RepID=UPI00045F242A|nr:sugar kinase [Geomicrobium sp. JCM 19039]GAK13608.1 2-dehydro-3-deoxygluconate kinase [Geomicrobium sp. JCM 19039]